MKNIWVYIISAFIGVFVFVVYADILLSYGISLKTALIFVAVIVLLIILAYAITYLIGKKIYTKDKNGDSEN